MKILISSPQKQLLLGRKVVVWLVNREIKFVGVVYQHLFPLLHCCATPAGDGILIYGLALVGNNQIFVNAHNLAISLAYGAGSDGVVEAEKMLCGLLKLNAVSLESSRELTMLIVDNHIA